MANQRLCETPFRDLLPDSITSDPAILAAADALDEELAEICTLVPRLAIWDSLDTATEPLLGNLAWQMHLDAAEGFELAETDEEKRALIRRSIEAHRHKGTRWALEQVAEILGMRMRIVEWWETDPPGEPYTFHLEFIEVTRPVGPEMFDQLWRLVTELKNVRSYLAGMTVYLTANGTFRLGGTSFTGQKMTLYPLQINEAEIAGNAPVPAAVIQYVNRMTIYPVEE